MRFSIRDLFWATLVIGLCLGWWLSYRAIDDGRLEAVGQADRLRDALLSGEQELIGKWKVVSMQENGE